MTPWKQTASFKIATANGEFVIVDASDGKMSRAQAEAMVKDIVHCHNNIDAIQEQRDELLKWLEVAEMMLAQTGAVCEFPLGARKNMSEMRAVIAKATGGAA